MAFSGLNSDVFSPIHSDISLNDTSLFSFGSLSGIPDFEKEMESPNNIYVEQDSDMNSVCKRTMKESATAFDTIVNDIQKQSNINAEKEEKFKDSYETLKHSIDELFYKKISQSSAPVSNDRELEEANPVDDVFSELKINKITEIPQNFTFCNKTVHSKSKFRTQILNRKSETKDNTLNREKKRFHQSKNISLKSKENKQYNEKTQLENEFGTKRENPLPEFQKPESTKMISSSTQTCESIGVAASVPNMTCETSGDSGKENLKTFYTQKQRKMPVSHAMPTTENKNLSIEKSIQIAIGIEMDNMRRFMLNQNVCFRKDLHKLQEMSRKQNEVSEYLFSVIDGLLEENRKLISKHK